MGFYGRTENQFPPPTEDEQALQAAVRPLGYLAWRQGPELWCVADKLLEERWRGITTEELAEFVERGGDWSGSAGDPQTRRPSGWLSSEN